MKRTIDSSEQLASGLICSIHAAALPSHCEPAYTLFASISIEQPMVYRKLRSSRASSEAPIPGRRRGKPCKSFHSTQDVARHHQQPDDSRAERRREKGENGGTQDGLGGKKDRAEGNGKGFPRSSTLPRDLLPEFQLTWFAQFQQPAEQHPKPKPSANPRRAPSVYQTGPFPSTPASGILNQTTASATVTRNQASPPSSEHIQRVATMAIPPAFADIAKSSNDVRLPACAKSTSQKLTA